ncbi:MAG: c-type cytochrome biogenesis protein CcsB [Omnitrophica bacterium]|nr:c-type cytochrome biogenesis protein CcsB [Candidatus Omnitrophota bacterium]
MNTLLFNITLVSYMLALIFYAVCAIFKKEGLGLFARGILILGLFNHTAAIFVRWVAAGRPPFSNMYESLIIFSWALILIYLIVEIIYRIRILGIFVSILALLILASASGLDSSIKPLMPALQSNWLVIHVLVCFIGYAAFAISFVSSIMYLILYKREAFEPGGRPLNTSLDTITYKTITFGFLFLTLGIITGAVWANRAWGRYWGWDPKETWALITWFIYAFYLHMRMLKGWKEVKGAWVAILGFLAVIFTYIGVNYLLPGLHSYIK